MGDKRSQTETVLRYLRTHRKGLTSMKAFWLFRITRLSAKIFDLRERGFVIQTIMEPNTFCSGNHGRYVLIKEPEEELCVSV